MLQSYRFYKFRQRTSEMFAWGDAVVLLVLAAVLYAGIYWARGASMVITGPTISLSPSALPWYASLSVGRMAAAYVLSLVFSLIYGSFTASSKLAERFMLPILDVLQSIPILSFLPVVLLSLSALLPQAIAVELAAIMLIFTSQAWNMTLAWYQSLISIPKELHEASTAFGFNSYLRFKTLQLPFAAISLIWNSMMSWSGGWFFLMASEIFSVGQLDFRLPGIGAYLHEAASKGDLGAIGWGVGVLILVIVTLDQLLWRPLLAWSDRFKLEMVEGDMPQTSWFYDVLLSSRFLGWLRRRIFRPAMERLDLMLIRAIPAPERHSEEEPAGFRVGYIFLAVMAAGLLYALYATGHMLFQVHWAQWRAIIAGLLASLLRVAAALLIAFAWTVPVGVAIGTNPRLAAFLQPLVQIVASLPATAIFPVVLLFILRIPGGLNLAAVLLMLLGTQWYLLFNIIAGAAAIPQDLKHTTVLLHMNRRERWKTLILPALFPYLVTGGIAASCGAWNASIVAEYVHFGGQTVAIVGVGAVIADATASANYPLLLASTLSLIITVILINRFGWRKLYRIAEEKYHME
jgi:NitT/TauT family transport system permease protein